MNWYLAVIVTALIAAWLLHLLADLLELRALHPALPAQGRDIYDEEQYRRSQDYTKAKLIFTQVRSTVILLATLLFILLGGFSQIDQHIRSVGLNSISTGLLFIGSLAMLSAAAELPFSLYRTFVLEERFGFNKTTAKTFVLDLLKTGALAVLIGGPLLALLLWFFESAGSAAWLWCWAAVTLFSLLMQFLAPAVLMPLFNKFNPLEDGELRQAVADYAKAHNFAIQGIYVMDGSKRSAKLNAFFAGFGRFRRIVFFDTLISRLTVGEIVAVLAHEMGHWRHRHIVKMTVALIAHTGLMFYFLSLVLASPQLHAAFGMEQISVYAGLTFFVFLYSPVELLLSVFLNMFSRRCEYQADAFAAASGWTKELISSLKKLGADNLVNLTPHPFKVFLEYSHPPFLARIAALQRLEQREHVFE
ncbi:CAAX prenyl protease 1-like protein [Candidatus Electronema halotolerans]